MKQNLLKYYVSLLRTDKDTQVSSEHKEQCVTALHNAIRTMCFSRNNKICEEDFSNLDFGNIPLNGIKFSIDGYVPSSFSGSTMHEWNLYSGHRYPVASANFSGNGKYIITADIRGNVLVWNSENGLVQNKYEADIYKENHCRECWAIISQNGCYAVIDFKQENSKTEEIVEIIELSTGKRIRVHSCECHSICFDIRFFSPVIALSHNERYLFTNGSSNNITLWNTSDGEFVRQFGVHDKRITSIGLSEDDTLCITGSADNTAKIWNTTTGECIQTLQKNGHLNTITAVDISRDKNYYITGAEDGIVKLWTLNGECKYTFPKHNRGIVKVRFTEDNNYCITISMDNTLKIWSIETGSLIDEYNWSNNPDPNIFKSVDINPVKNEYIYLCDEGFMIKKLDNNSVFSNFKYHYSSIVDICLSQNFFLIALNNNKAILFDKYQKKNIGFFSIDDIEYCLEHVEISSDERYFMTYFKKENITHIIIYDLSTKKIVNVIDEYTNIINASFVPKHDWIFVLTSDGFGRCLDIETKDVVYIYNGSKYKWNKEFRYNHIYFSQDGQYFYYWIYKNVCILWKINNEEPTFVFEEKNIDNTFMYRYPILPVCNKYFAVCTNEFVIIKDIQTGNVINRKPIYNIRDAIAQRKEMFYFFNDGDYYVISENNYEYSEKLSNITVKMIETKSGRIKRYMPNKTIKGFIRWKFPYYFCFNDNYVDVYE